MKTPEEIKKGLECCVTAENSDTCNACPYFDGSGELHCISTLAKDAIDYIKQLEADAATFYAKATETKAKVQKDYEGFVDVIHALADQIPQWVSVKERLPDGDGKYIVCTTKGSVYCAKFSNRGGPYFHTDMNTHIAYWMPLPEPPEDE